MLMTPVDFILWFSFVLFCYDRLVLWNKSLHDEPTNEVGNRTNAEHNHISSRLAFKTECHPWICDDLSAMLHYKLR